MFQGLRTVIYRVPDLAKAKAWYTEAFGVAPYFDEPFYVGFQIGGFELGSTLTPPASSSATTPSRTGACPRSTRRTPACSIAAPSRARP